MQQYKMFEVIKAMKALNLTSDILYEIHINRAKLV
jgi:hypothetical protein